MKKILVLLIVCFLTGCTLLSNKPEDSVRSFLLKYKNNDKEVIDELDEYLASENLENDVKEEYKKVYLRQYSNLRYEIKDSVINGDEATVQVMITVYDYYKENMLASDYYHDNMSEFVNDKGDLDLSKYLQYRLNKLLTTDNDVSYTIDFKLNKVDDKWEMEPISVDTLEKIHGTYEY